MPEKSSNGQSRKKHRKFEGNSTNLSNVRGQVHGEPELTEEERLNILRYVEEEEAAANYETLDENGLRKMVLLFEKRNLRNQEMRIKFPDNPEKFMDSEIELHAVISEMKNIATTPDLYPLLVELNAIPSLLELVCIYFFSVSVNSD